MQDYKHQILDEPEPKNKPKPNLKVLGIPLGFIVGAITNFMLLICIDFIRFAGNEQTAFIIVAFVLISISAILYLIFSFYKFFNNKFLLLNGLFAQITGLIAYMKIIDAKTWNEILHKPHLFSYPALSFLLFELLILLAWIIIIKGKKKALGIILLIIIIIFGITLE